MYPVIGEQWDPRSHDLRDGLTVNGVPFDFHTQDSELSRQLIGEYQVDVNRFTGVIQHDGIVLHQPSMRQLAGAHGIQIRPAALA